MNQTTAEIIILTINALGAGVLLMIATVVQRIMNDMDELTFKNFLNKLDRTAMTSPFAITIATLPNITMIWYFIAYGFNHWWYIAGFILWVIGGSITKISNMPIYKWIGNPDNTDLEELRKKRKALGKANNLRAWITFLSVICMACQFGWKEVLIVVAISVAITPPLLWLGRKYLPN